MATENRSIQVEAGSVIIRVEGPDSLKAQEALVNRLLEKASSGTRIPLGFQSGASLVIERAEEP